MIKGNKISKDTTYQRYRPEVKQGYWRYIKTQAGATQDIETYKWVDYITPTRLNTQRERIRFADWLITPEIAEYRSRIRRNYSLAGYNHKDYNLQQLCLIAYSTANNRPIDSIVLEVNTDSLSINTCRLAIEDNRGIPIKASTLVPYSLKELEEHICEPLKQWLSAGGFERYITGGTSFWVDIWEINLTEKDPILQWLVPEAKSGEILQTPQITRAEADQEARTNQGEGEHRPQLSSVSYHQDITQHKTMKNRGKLTNNQQRPLEMPMMMVRTVNIKIMNWEIYKQECTRIFLTP
jgi:phosphatidylserine decarboxylase